MIYFHTSYCFLLDAKVEAGIFLAFKTVSTSFTWRSVQYWLRQERNIAIVFRDCSPPLTTDLFCWGNSLLLNIVLWINIHLEWHQEHKERQMEHKQRTQREKEFRTLFAKTGNVRPSVCPVWNKIQSPFLSALSEGICGPQRGWATRKLRSVTHFMSSI